MQLKKYVFLTYKVHISLLKVGLYEISYKPVCRKIMS